MPDPVTPFAEAVALLEGGASAEAVAEKLKARGLDPLEIELLLKAVKSRAPGAVEAASQWLDSPPPEVPEREAPVDPDAPLGPCSRCGTFVTARTSGTVLGKTYCAACAERPDVDYLRVFRDRYWGTRDAWAWYFGVSGVFTVLLGAAMLFGNGGTLEGGLTLASGVASLFFWGGAKPARAAVLVVAIASLALSVVGGLFNLAVTVSALRSVRTRLFFELEPTTEELQVAWQSTHDNQIALWGRGVSVVALLSCLLWLTSKAAVWVSAPLGLLGVVLSLIGLARVDAMASPPIGRKRTAIAGVVLGGSVMLASAVRFFFQFFGSRLIGNS